MLRITIKPKSLSRFYKGFPWVYAQDIKHYQKYASIKGELVTLLDDKNQAFAIGYFNSQSKLACRILTFNPKQSIDTNFFIEKFAAALSFRENRFKTPYYRLVHGESDKLPGLIIDRFNDRLVCQTNTAGMDRLKIYWQNALEFLLNPCQLIYREDVPLREKEGLVLNENTQNDSALCTVEENDFLYYVDLIQGQKTGWFYDQRANRAWLAERVKHKTVLDLYSYCGGFGLLAAKKGALKVTLVDSSQKALDLAQLAAERANLSCDFIKADIFSLLPILQEQGQTFDVVAVDPPAFVKQQKYQAQGLKGYQKLAKMVSPLVAKGGLFMITSCSHHASSFEFRQAIEQGMQKAKRNFRLIRKSGADSDHPIHPLLPETHYLKNLSYLLE